MSRARDTADQINRVNSSAADATAITVDGQFRSVVLERHLVQRILRTFDTIELNPNGRKYYIFKILATGGALIA